MGGGNYNEDVTPRRSRRAASLFSNSGQSNSAHAAFNSGRREVHDELNIKGKKRECVDHPNHSDTLPIAICMDVTSSRGKDVQTIYEKLPMLIGQLIQSGIIPRPALSLSAIGDASSGDYAPIQIGQFESDERLDKVLEKIWLEGGGGGTGQESYELTAYYYAMHSILDSVKKRGKKGYMFITGDEGFYPTVKKDQIKLWIGDDVPEDIPSTQVFAKLQEQYEVFFIYVQKKWEDRLSDIDTEIKTRVKGAGGMIDGIDMGFSLFWPNENDLDAHCIDPDGKEIYYQDKCPYGQDGFLDVDMNVSGETRKPVENIRWAKGKAKKGRYKFFVRNYGTHCGNPCETPFHVRLEVNGEVQIKEGKTPKGKTGPSSDVVMFEIDYDPQPKQNQEDRYAMYQPEVILGQWGSVLPPSHIICIQEPKACIDAIMGCIALNEGKMDLKKYLKSMRARGQTDERCADITKALEGLSKTGAVEAVASEVFDAPAEKKKKKKKTSRV